MLEVEHEVNCAVVDAFGVESNAEGSEVSDTVKDNVRIADRKFEVLSPERQQLVEANLDFTKSLAGMLYKKYNTFGIERKETQAICYLALCTAAQRYDATRSIAFQTFAYWRIVGSIMDLLRAEKKSGFQYRAYRAMKDVNVLCTSSTEHRKHNAEIMGLKIFKLSKGQDAEVAYMKGYNPEHIVIRKNVRSNIEKAMNRLSYEERELIRAHYFQEKSFVEVCDEHGSPSKSWATRTHNKALKKLKMELNKFSREYDDLTPCL